MQKKQVKQRCFTSDEERLSARRTIGSDKHSKAIVRLKYKRTLAETERTVNNRNKPVARTTPVITPRQTPRQWRWAATTALTATRAL